MYVGRRGGLSSIQIGLLKVGTFAYLYAMIRLAERYFLEHGNDSRSLLVNRMSWPYVLSSCRLKQKVKIDCSRAESASTS